MTVRICSDMTQSPTDLTFTSMFPSGVRMHAALLIGLASALLAAAPAGDDPVPAASKPAGAFKQEGSDRHQFVAGDTHAAEI